jgi:hypothetical protein
MAMSFIGSAEQAAVLDSVWFLILWVTSALLLEGIVIDLLVKVAKKATSNRSSQRAACLPSFPMVTNVPHFRQ